MPRPRKNRRICSLPNYDQFGPCGRAKQDGISMTVDEYEVIRLIDFAGMTQEECASQMDVARTTIQAIYASARKKIAECIVLGKHLQISGGDVSLCEHKTCACVGGYCPRRQEHHCARRTKAAQM